MREKLGIGRLSFEQSTGICRFPKLGKERQCLAVDFHRRAVPSRVGLRARLQGQGVGQIAVITNRAQYWQSEIQVELNLIPASQCEITRGQTPVQQRGGQRLRRRAGLHLQAGGIQHLGNRIARRSNVLSDAEDIISFRKLFTAPAFAASARAVAAERADTIAEAAMYSAGMHQFQTL
jgi:hypothetical protein